MAPRCAFTCYKIVFTIKACYLAGGPQSVIILPSRSGSNCDISSRTISEPLWNSDVGRGRVKFAVKERPINKLIYEYLHSWAGFRTVFHSDYIVYNFEAMIAQR